MREQAVAVGGGDETLGLEFQRTARVLLTVPGDGTAAGALQELPARQLQVRIALQVCARLLSAAAAAAGEAQPVWVRLRE